jgi:hypothetical protein
MDIHERFPERVTVASGPPPFDPTTIAGLKLWLKADSLALSDGTAVATWTDNSGLGNNATQGTAGQRPTFQANVVNGKPVIRFLGGASQVFGLAGIDAAGVWTVIAVTRPLGSNILTVLANNGSNAPEAFTHYSNGNTYMSVMAGNRYFVSTATLYGSFHVFSANTGANFYADGTSLGATIANAWSGSTIFNSIGFSGAGTGYSNGDIAEILLYNNIISTTDRQAVENYLKTKYGTP